MAAIEIEELNSTNCKTYLLTCGGEAALVDPVRERLVLYQQVLTGRQLRLRMVLETHTHADHLSLGRATHDILGVPLVCHEASPSPLVDRHVVDGERITLGDAAITVWHTPGHTPDSMCLLVDGAVLTGDTLLIGGSGRTDFPGGDAGAQYDHVTRRLFALPDATVVWPGHDYRGHTSSTIGAEKAANPRFLGRDREQYIAAMAALGLPFPERVQQVLQVAGSLLVPLDALARRLPKLLGYHDRELVVVCRAGARSCSAGAILRLAGFTRVQNLAGGMLQWTRAGLPVQR